MNKKGKEKDNINKFLKSKKKTKVKCPWFRVTYMLTKLFLTTLPLLALFPQPRIPSSAPDMSGDYLESLQT